MYSRKIDRYFLYGRFSVHSTRLSARHFRLVNRIRRPACSRIENSIRDTRRECAPLATKDTSANEAEDNRYRASFSPRKTNECTDCRCVQSRARIRALLLEYQRRHCDLPVNRSTCLAYVMAYSIIPRYFFYFYALLPLARRFSSSTIAFPRGIEVIR